MSIKTNNYPGSGLLDFLRKAFGGELSEPVQRPHASDTVGHLKGKSGAKDRFEMASPRVDSPFQRASRPLTSLDPQRMAVLDQVLKMELPKKA